MSKFSCPNCGERNRSEARFCKKCGAHLLAGRYAITKTLQSTESVEVYEALDAWRCQCGALLIDAPEDLACPACETTPYQPLTCQIYKRAKPPTPSHRDNNTEMWLYDEHGEAWYSVMRPQWQVEYFPHGYRLLTGYASHRGQRASVNEDAVLLQTISRIFTGNLYTLGIFAVADGMGGHTAGEIVSRTAIDTLFTSLLRQMSVDISDDVQWTKDVLKQALDSTNKQVFELCQDQQLDSGTTLTAAMINAGTAIVANVGDSRTYLFRAGQLTPITHDQSLVYRLIQEKQITPEEIYTHPRRNEVYRYLGGKPQVEVDIFDIKLEPQDRLLLCCDGLWEMVHDEPMAQVLEKEPDPQKASDLLIEQANAAGGDDNISVIIVDIQASEIME